MLDVLHFYFEEDFGHPSAESAARNSLMRETLYTSLYEMEYKYKIESPGESKPKTYEDYEDADDAEDYSDINVFSPSTRPYVAPTEMKNDEKKPFGDILDSPLG